MKYNALGKTGFKVSEVGLGCEHLQGKPYEQVDCVVHAALNGGVNLLDVFMSEPEVRTNIGKALASRRKDVYIQGHIGAIWENGQYAASRDIAKCEAFIQDFCARFQTDYIDMGMLHFIDDPDEWTRVANGPMMEYAQKLKAEGRIHALGMSSHNPITAKRAAKSGLIDMIMFAINPAFDLLPAVPIDDLFNGETFSSDSLIGINPERADMYRACEDAGIGITVMKAFAGGMLFNNKVSPFGKAFTPHQLMAYALSRPCVASVLVGCETPKHVDAALAYERATDDEKDYVTALSGLKHYPVDGRCMYCNHCLPCPAKIDIAQVNRYLDAAKCTEHIPESIREHYHSLKNTASACIRCGMCEARCPFGVQVRERMDEASALFGS